MTELTALPELPAGSTSAAVTVAVVPGTGGAPDTAYKAPLAAGAAGAAGVGITSALVNGAGHLILSRTDGVTVDAGLVLGATGAAGAPGVAGAAGVGIAGLAINGAGHLIVTLTGGATVDAGLLPAGPAGAAGAAGAAGVGIVSATVNGAGHLVLTRSDGSTVDAGYVVGAAGAAGTAGAAGAVGAAGAAGVGVGSLAINGAGHLIVTLTSGATLDAGAIPVASIATEPAAAALTGSEAFAGLQGGANVAVSLAQLTTYIAAILASITPVQPPASGVYQRTSDTGGTFNKGAGPVPFSITAGVGGVPLNYRLRDAVANGNPVLVPSTQAVSSLASGTQTVTVAVPASASWYLIDWQAGSGAWVLGTQRFAVGDVLAVAGQSLAAFFLSVSGGGGYTDSTTLASLGLAVPAVSAELASYELSPGAAVQNPSPTWATPADGTFYAAAGAVEYMSRMVALTGVAQGVAGFAVGGSTISQWAVGQTFNTQLKAALTAAGKAFRTLLWVQGHDDAKAGTTAAAYQAALGAIIADLASTYPGRAFKRVVMSIPSLTSTYSTTAAAVQAIRAGSKAYAASDAAAAYVDALDVALNDGVHPTQAGYVTLADHVYRAVAGLAGFRTNGDAGPSITGGTRAAGSAVVALAVQQAGGTGLVTVGTPANQFAVFNSGTTSSPLTVSSVAAPNATTLNLTLSAAPADAQALDVYVRYPFDVAAAVTSGIYDNATDGDGITRGRQLVMPAAAVTVAAPTPSTMADFTGVSGLAAWYRPSDSSTVTASGGSVSQVNDISGQARHATRAASTKPTLASAVLNGLPVLAFDGTAQALEMDNLAAALAGTTGASHVFAVVRLTASASSSIYPAFFALQAASPAADYGDGLFAYTNGNNPSWGSARANGTTQAYADATSNGNAAATNTWYIVEATWDGVGQTGVAVNGGAFTTGGSNTGAAGSVAYAKGRLGVRWNGSAEVRPWPGQMAELAVVSGSILSGTARTNRLKYLNARYALGIAGLT